MKYQELIQALLSLVAVLFGIATIVAGSRVHLGADPGYHVFHPLLIYNTVMGVVYIAAGLVAWFSVRQGGKVAAAIFALNLVVLAVIAWLYVSGEPVAIESVRAMILRTGLWLVLAIGLVWLDRRARPDRK